MPPAVIATLVVTLPMMARKPIADLFVRHLIDTHPGLDGDFTSFTDLMHLTQTGRQKVADAFFATSK